MVSGSSYTGKSYLGRKDAVEIDPIDLKLAEDHLSECPVRRRV